MRTRSLILLATVLALSCWMVAQTTGGSMGSPTGAAGTTATPTTMKRLRFMHLR